jgi:3-oxoacyl-[acyl-carrier protein] reductase
MTWNDQVAFVTGASQGIGRACAVALAEAGARVAIASRSVDQLQMLAGEIGKTTGTPERVLPLRMDASREDEIVQAFARAQEHLGKIDILVNNAGINRDGLAVVMKRKDWDDVLATNLTGYFLCIQQVLRGMSKRRHGRIINISSVVAYMGNAGQANYVASKAGILGLTRALAQEYASRNITVNAVAPGFIETAMTEKISVEAREKLAGRIPLARLGRPEDVAAAVKFLASEEAGYITGQVLHVNGGLYLGG